MRAELLINVTTCVLTDLFSIACSYCNSPSAITVSAHNYGQLIASLFSTINLATI